MAFLGSARPYLALVAAAALGGGLAVGAVALLGGLEGGETTVVTETAASETTEATSTTKPPRWMSVGEIYEHAAPGVVQIASTSNVGGVGGDDSALGSGFVVDKEGHIVTNYHVIEGASQIRVSFSNRDTVVARLVGTDATTDLAVLQVDASPNALTASSISPAASRDFVAPHSHSPAITSSTKSGVVMTASNVR